VEVSLQMSRASIVDAINEAKRTLKDVKTWDGLGEWTRYWFGDE